MGDKSRSEWDRSMDQLRALRESGLGINAIAQRLGVPSSVVIYHLTSTMSLSDLDPRAGVHLERDRVAALVAQGLSTNRIAEELGISPNRVRDHRTARSGELSRAKEKGLRDELHRADRAGAAPGLQPVGQLPVKRQPGGQTKTGVKGVVTHRGRFQVTVRHRYIGMFTTMEEAALAAEAAWEVAS